MPAEPQKALDQLVERGVIEAIVNLIVQRHQAVHAEGQTPAEPETPTSNVPAPAGGNEALA